MARPLHFHLELMPAAARLTVLTLAATLAAVTSADADCPTNIRDMAPTGLLASITQLATSPGEIDAPPGVQARIGAAGGMRAEGGRDMAEASVDGSAGIGGEVRAQRAGFTGCASGDVIDVRDGSAHVTASGQIPLLITGLTLGFSLDRDVTRPLSARNEYLRIPVSRVAAQFSSSFLDFALTDPQKNRLRLLVVPFTVEQAVARQSDTSVSVTRHTTRFETAMLRFVASNPQGAQGDYALFTFEADWMDPAEREKAAFATYGEFRVLGFIRFAPLSIAHDGTEWGFDLDGGVLSLAGPVGCDRTDCNKGWGRAALRHTWELWSLEGRVERDAFIAADDLPALENRASMTAAVESGATRATTTAFVADTKAWLDRTGGQRAGLRATLSHELGRGFSGLLDSEVMTSNAMQPELASGARLLLSLASDANAPLTLCEHGRAAIDELRADRHTVPEITSCIAAAS